MFEFIRTHKRWMQLVLLLLILPSFVFVGLEGYSKFGDRGSVLATVDGQSITPPQFEAAQRERANQLRQMLGERFDPSVLNTVTARQRIVQDMVDNRVLTAESKKRKFIIGDDLLRHTIKKIEYVQENGQFSKERYKEILSLQGFTPASFEARLRQDLALRQVTEFIDLSIEPFSKTSAERLIAINSETREVRLQPYLANDFASRVELPEKELKAYYTQHIQEFRSDEQADVEYLVLEKSALNSKIAIQAAEIQDYYNQNISHYQSVEQRRASHILIESPKDAPATQRVAAKEKAEFLLALAKKPAQDFADLARKNSEDKGSATKGGDLGWFGTGAMVKPFEEATFKLAVNEISGLVQSDFGYHIIKLTGIRPPEVKSLDAVKPEIEAALREQKLAKQFAESAESLAALTEEHSDNLKPAAEKLGLSIKVATGISKLPAVNAKDAKPDSPDALFNAKLRASLFSPDHIKSLSNTEVVEVRPNTLVVARLRKYSPAATLAYEQALTQVRHQLAFEKGFGLAKKAGEEALAKSIKTDGDTPMFDNRIPVQSVSRKSKDLPPALLKKIMEFPADKLPAYVGTEVPGQGYWLVYLLKTQVPTVEPKLREQEINSLKRIYSEAEARALLDALALQYKVKINKEQISKASTTEQEE